MVANKKTTGRATSLPCLLYTSHLLGYDHLDEGEEKRKMRGREEAIAASIPNMSRD